MGLYDDGAKTMWGGMGEESKRPADWKIRVALQRAKDGLTRVREARQELLQHPADIEGAHLSVIGAERCFNDVIENLE
jgi:hypothetical protein